MAPSVSSPPSSPQLLTTSGYTCSGEFRFQTERCLALVFCRTHIKSRHTLSPSGPVVREGESLTACYAHRHTFETSPAPASSPPRAFLLSSSPLTAHMHSPYRHESRWKDEKLLPLRGHKVYHLPLPRSHCHTANHSLLLQTVRVWLILTRTIFYIKAVF